MRLNDVHVLREEDTLRRLRLSGSFFPANALPSEACQPPPLALRTDTRRKVEAKVDCTIERHPSEMFTSASGDVPPDDVMDPSGHPAVTRIGAAPVHLPGGEVLREVEINRAEADRLIDLKEAVYGRPVDRAVFDWHYFGHPRCADFRLFVVEHEGKLIASTTRMPATIRAGGEDCPTFFNIDSMVHPERRRRGCMRDLYKYARDSIGGAPIFLSKGSSSQIYPLLMTVGHRPVTPDTQLVSYPSTTRWLMSRLRLGGPAPQRETAVVPGFEDYRPIERFGADFDAFFARISKRFPAICVRDAAFMNWRYGDIPHRRYLCYARMVNGQMAGLVVLSIEENQMRIVDILWDPDRNDAPYRTVRFAQALCNERQVVRVVCFATDPRLREALVRAKFVDRGETPRFSIYVPASREAALAGGMHVVDGDGDTEFS